MVNVKKVLFSGILLGSALLATGCSDRSASEGGDEVTTLTIAQMPDENNENAGSKNEEFRTALAEELGIEVIEMEGSEYSVGIEAMKAGNLDVMLVSPMSYYQAKKVANVDPLVTTTVTEGTVPYTTKFIVNGSDTTTKSLADLEGETFAFVDPASSSGYMFPKAKLISELDLDTDQIENPGYFFESVAYSGSHDSSVMGVVNGDYAGAAVAGQIIQNMVDSNVIDEDDVRVIDETDVIPNACFVMRSDLPEDIKEKLRDFYMNYDNEDYFESFYGDPSVRFIEAKDEDYAIIDEMVDALNLSSEDLEG